MWSGPRQAVREAASLPAQEALQAKVIEYVATDLDDLLKQLDGKTVKVQDQARTLKTAGAPIVQHQPDWRAQASWRSSPTRASR